MKLIACICLFLCIAIIIAIFIFTQFMKKRDATPITEEKKENISKQKKEKKKEGKRKDMKISSLVSIEEPVTDYECKTELLTEDMLHEDEDVADMLFESGSLAPEGETFAAPDGPGAFSIEDRTELLESIESGYDINILKDLRETELIIKKEPEDIQEDAQDNTTCDDMTHEENSPDKTTYEKTEDLQQGYYINKIIDNPFEIESGMTFISCRLSNIKMVEAICRNVTFINSSLTNVSFLGSDLDHLTCKDTEFTSCNFKYASIKNSILSNVKIKNSNLEKAEFDNSILKDVDYKENRLDEQTSFTGCIGSEIATEK